MENTTLLRYISLFMLLPTLALADMPTPSSDELKASYDVLLADYARSIVNLNAQILADKREIARLQAEAAKGPEKH